MSKSLFKNLYAGYQRAGVDELRVSANLDVGGYTWAKYGFCAPKDEVSRIVHKLFEKSSPAYQAFENFYKAHPEKTPFPMHLIIEADPDAKNKLLGSEWEGTLDLHDPEQTAVFERYLGIKEGELPQPAATPITDYDTEVEDLRQRALRWELNLTTMERIRNEGKDKKALLAEIKALQKQIKERTKLENASEYTNRIAIIDAGKPIKELAKISPKDAQLADLQSRMTALDTQRRGILTGGAPYTQRIAAFNAMLPGLQTLQADAEQAMRTVVDTEMAKFDSDIDALRTQTVMYDLDLAEIERLRTTGAMSKEIKQLQTEIKRAKKERNDREKRWNEKIKELKNAVKELKSVEAAFVAASPTADEKTAFQDAVKEAEDALADNAITPGNTYTTATNTLVIATTKAQQAKADADKVVSKAATAPKWLENINTKGFSSSEIDQASQAVQNKIKGWEELPLDVLIKKIQFEIQYLENNKKYTTWEMAKEAYENYLNKIQNFDAFNNDDTAAREIENRKETKTIWGSLTKKEKTLITKYTETYSYLNEPLRGLPYSGARPPEDFKNDLKPLTNGIAKSITQREMVVRRGTDSFPIP